MSTNNYTDGYFSIDVERGELLHGGISVGRIILTNGQIYTELDDTSSDATCRLRPLRDKRRGAR